MTDDLVCNCGACGFKLNISLPKLSLLCACEDCLQALQWGASKGGNSPMALPELIYVRSALLAVIGKNFMRRYISERVLNQPECTALYAFQFLALIIQVIGTMCLCFSKTIAKPTLIFHISPLGQSI